VSWKPHFGLEGKHALLSPSNSAWTNYSEEKLIQRLETIDAAQRGTELHELAHRLINLGEYLPDRQRTLNMYVNDALDYKMTSELMLYYSYNGFGTADTISFWDGFLRIHDLKTGITKVNERQLELYAALFCLEYEYAPEEIEIELRIYKDDEIHRYVGDDERVRTIRKYMETYENHNRIVEEYRAKKEAKRGVFHR
jgi:hypothetical protein